MNSAGDMNFTGTCCGCERKYVAIQMGEWPPGSCQECGDLVNWKEIKIPNRPRPLESVQHRIIVKLDGAWQCEYDEGYGWMQSEWTESYQGAPLLYVQPGGLIVVSDKFVAGAREEERELAVRVPAFMAHAQKEVTNEDAPRLLDTTYKGGQSPFVPTHWMPLREYKDGLYKTKDGNCVSPVKPEDWGIVEVDSFRSPNPQREKMLVAHQSYVEEKCVNIQKSEKYWKELASRRGDGIGFEANRANRAEARCDRLELELRRAGRKVPE